MRYVPPGSRWAGTIVPFEPPLLRIRYPHGVYVTLEGFADWLPYARALVELPPVDPGVSFDRLRVTDVLTANETMARAGDPLWARGENGVAGTPDGWLWRHLPDSRRIALLPGEVAVAFRHAGGIATTWPPHGGTGLTAVGGGVVSFVPADDPAEVDLAGLEAGLPAPLPVPYRDFMVTTGGGRPRVPAVHPESGFVLDQSFLHSGRGRKNMLNNVGYLRRWFADRFTDDYLAIARVQGGLLALRLTGPDAGSVWFWDADDPRDDDRYDAAVVSRDLLRRCADGFDSFLNAVAPVPDALREAARTALDSGLARVLRDPDMAGSLLARDRAAATRA